MTLKVVEVTPAISIAPAYSAGDTVGGLLEFEDVCSAFENTGRIVGAVLVDKASQAGAYVLHLFDRAIAAPTDNAAFDPTDSELNNYLGGIRFLAADYLAFNDNSVCVPAAATPPLSVPIVLVAGGTSLFAVLVTSTTPDFVAIDDIRLKLLVEV